MINNKYYNLPIVEGPSSILVSTVDNLPKLSGVFDLPLIGFPLKWCAKPN